jgi:hypothetical protein
MARDSQELCDRFATNEGYILLRQQFSLQVMRAPSGALAISRGGGVITETRVASTDTRTNETTWTLKVNTTNEKTETGSKTLPNRMFETCGIVHMF